MLFSGLLPCDNITSDVYLILDILNIFLYAVFKVHGFSLLLGSLSAAL